MKGSGSRGPEGDGSPDSLRGGRLMIVACVACMAGGLIGYLTMDRSRNEIGPGVESCLHDVTSVRIASGKESDYLLDSPDQGIDASGVYWLGRGRESRLVGVEGEHAACFSGGAKGAVLDGGMPEDAMYECTAEHCGGTCPTPCYAYHSAAGLGPDVGALVIVEDLEIRNSGDGISLHSEVARDAVVRRVYLHNIHDDAFESDFGLAGFTIEDVLAERTNTAFAMRLRSSASGDQRDKLWTIRNNLIRLHEFPNGYKQRPGHGNVFKLDKSANEPRFRMTGNMIVVGPDAGGSTLFPPVSRVEECAENVYLFVGTQAGWQEALDSDDIEDGGNNGERMAALNQSFPGCFEVRVRPDGMTEAEFLAAEGWTTAVANWKASHVAGSSR